MSRTPGLLDGPDLSWGAESFDDHARRLGTAPRGGAELIGSLQRSGLTGRGGASFPVGAKWATVAGRRRGGAVVLANGAEGEPLSRKDRTLMAARPHLVLDGAFLAAEAVGAEEVVFYIGEEHAAARRAVERALAERPRTRTVRRVRISSPPARYVAGEESAAVHFLDEGVALPKSVPPRPFERGVGGLPTVVQNVESLAHAALIARFGPDRFREAGRDGAPGTVLATVSRAAGAGAGERPHGFQLLEVPAGTAIGELATATGWGPRVRAVLLGGFFGSWVDGGEAMSLPLDPARLRERGLSLGCGVVHLLPEGACGVCATAEIMGLLAAESAAQCGPCFFGLGAIAAASKRLAEGAPEPGDLQRLDRWAGQLPGRGACRHPDGAAGLLRSALKVFEAEYATHRGERHGRWAAA